MHHLQLLGAGLLLTTLTVVSAAPKSEPWERWMQHDPDADTRIDHGAWDSFLSRYLVEAEDSSRVDYGGVSLADRRALREYLDRLSEVPVSRHDRNEQLAYWINFYNALTVEVVLEHHPVASIMDIDISPGLFANGPWGRKLAFVEGEALSLDDIEHRILRPIWRDPRIHYALNCASVGCPDLQARAFTADALEQMLDAGARRFVNSRRGSFFEDGDLYVSSIYEWFKEDFGGTDAGVIAHLRRYADDALAARLAATDRIRESFYDWTLNEATRGEQTTSSGQRQSGRSKEERGSSTR